MTPVLELLLRLNNAGISLKAEGGQLRILAPVGALTPALREELLSQKTAVLDLLKNYNDGNRFPREAIRRLERGGCLPLSFAQERLWFLDQLEPDSAVYNIPMGFRLGGALNVPVLRRCLNEVLRRHESLRTSFKAGEGQPVQVIQSEASLEMPLADLRDLPNSEREAKADRLCTEEAQRPFDLTRDLLLRARLFRLGEVDHILLLNMHHIASDGWSVGLLVGELSTLYEAFVEGKPSPLPELPVQYVDFAVWQREWLQGEALEKQLGYWRKQLEGAPALLELPTDRPRPAVQSYRGALMSWELPKPLLVALGELSQREGATLFMTLLASFQTLLHRYTSSDDILVGSPIAGRNWREIEPLIGFFINTLVLRGDLSGNPTFRTFLGRTREAALRAYAHQDIPFERLVEELHPERNLSRSPVFQVMFVLQNAPWKAAELAGLEVTPKPIDSGISKFDLTLSVRERGEALHAVVAYNTDLFEAETIRRMLGHYQTLLEGIVSNPDQRLSELPLLTSAEHQQLLVDWNRTEVDYPRDRCLHELIEEQVERTPDAIAVVFEDKHLTYRQLNERANQLAHYLQKLGVGPDTLVGICVERSLEMVVGLLGILKAGGAYVPLDPEYPKERLAFMLEDAAVLVLLTQAHLTASLPAHQARVVRLDADWPLVAEESVGHVTSSVSAEHLAYMIYTSGSTGRPKGAMITHVAIVNRLLWMQDAYRLTPSDRVLQKTPFSFDVSVWEFFWPLLTGAKLVVAPPGGHKDGAYLANLICKEEITTTHFVPSMLSAFLEQGGLESSCASLKRVICSGEALPFELQQRFFSLLPAELHNLYGPTEAAVDVTYWACEREDRLRTVPIGRPIANTQIRILDQHLQPVPIGVPGELHIGGIGLARGYHNRPELTAEKFIPDPFRSEPEARLYKTGDLVRYLPNGAIEYLGRLDHQVKIRGFRIELGEIESVLAELPAVREAVVVAREDIPGDKRLVAYLTSRGGEAQEDLELRRQLQDKLPEYMVPSTFVTLDEFPLTPNGKLDRKALPAPGNRKEPNEHSYVAPTSYSEQVLCRIWCKWLNTSAVGIKDNFFDLGGNSLLVIGVVGDINKTLEADLRVATFFQNPNVEQLARVLEHKSLDRPRQPRLFQLRPGRIGPTLYFIGNGPTEIRIAESVSEERAVFGTDVPIPAEWVHGLAAADPARLGALCADLADLVLTHARSSRCVIVGYCLFGIIAFETARALQRAGGNVASVVLIDAFRGKHAFPGWRHSLRWIWHDAAPEITSISGLSAFLRNNWLLVRWMLRRMPKSVKRRSKTLFHPASNRLTEYFDNEGNSVELTNLAKLVATIRRSLDSHPLDTSGVLFRADYSDEAILPGHDFSNGWSGSFLRGLEVVEMTGGHEDLVRDEKNAAEIARYINVILDRLGPDNQKRIGAEGLGSGPLGKTNERDEVRQIAASRAKLPEILRAKRLSTTVNITN